MPRGRLIGMGLGVILILGTIACGSGRPYAVPPIAGRDPVAPPSTGLPPASPLYRIPTAPPTLTPTPTPTPRPSPTPLPTATPVIPLSELRKTPLPPANVLGHGLGLPPGFQAGVYAKELASVRILAYSPDGVLFASLPGLGKVVALPDRDGNGEADRTATVVQGLVRPTGLAFWGPYLYVAEAHQIVRYVYEPATLGVSGGPEVVVSLPVGGGHMDHAIGFGPDGKLYVAIGSSCNACREADYRRATIMRYNPDGGREEVYAQGLRAVEGFLWYPNSQQLLATNCSRIRMTDDLPPDTIEMVAEGGNYGWPFCHAGDIPDPELGWPDSCEGAPRPLLQLPAQTTPKGICVYTGSQFPAEYRGSLLVAMYGSWERKVPVGYKIVRVRVESGRVAGVEDFVTGWLVYGQPWGRPTDVIEAADGSILVADEVMGAIYRISYASR